MIVIIVKTLHVVLFVKGKFRIIGHHRLRLDFRRLVRQVPITEPRFRPEHVVRHGVTSAVAILRRGARPDVLRGDAEDTFHVKIVVLDQLDVTTPSARVHASSCRSRVQLQALQRLLQLTFIH